MTAPSGLVLLDTNVVLQLFRGNDFGQRIDATYELRGRPDPPLVSIITVGEVLALAKQRGWGRDRVDRVRELLREFVVVDINLAVVERYAEIVAFAVQNGRRPGDNDLWIAATAAATAAMLITTDADFDPFDGKLIRLSRFELTTKSS